MTQGYGLATIVTKRVLEDPRTKQGGRVDTEHRNFGTEKRGGRHMEGKKGNTWGAGEKKLIVRSRTYQKGTGNRGEKLRGKEKNRLGIPTCV